MTNDTHAHSSDEASTPWGVASVETVTHVADVDPDLSDAVGVPTDRPARGIDVRDAPAPKPLTRTLEELETMDDRSVLLQRNDRVPTHLFEQLDDRGFRFGTVEREAEALTAIWRE
ncbi:DUF2249 domain-containing protein [Halobaculum limi]|uniref:DUF2249 domain-containing protein n=1 Tax=Halobaculum limi TaxID=3031916 RepID=UPI002AA2A958|nr:DUF2249 domain-containing protein [Halobaculum sp. YSMS11]